MRKVKMAHFKSENSKFIPLEPAVVFTVRTLGHKMGPKVDMYYAPGEGLHCFMNNQEFLLPLYMFESIVLEPETNDK